MPIDTREDRQAAAGVNVVVGPSVTPDADKDAAWRQQAGHGYSGFTTSEVDYREVGGSGWRRVQVPSNTLRVSVFG